MEKAIECRFCLQNIECDGDPGPVGALRIPGNHNQKGELTELAECPGSEMLGVVHLTAQLS